MRFAGVRRRRKRTLWVVAGLFLLLLCTLTALRYFPRPALSDAIAQSRVVFDEQGELLRLSLARDQQYRLWVPLSQVSPRFIEALLLHEDQYFRWHLGINPLAVLRAMRDMASGARRQGASTISMQLARLYYGLNTRSFSGKLKQMVLALWLEARYSKHDILEAHINLLPYGGNIQGVGTAALIYFDKPVAALSLPELLSLVLIPQSPARRAPDELEPESLRLARQQLFERWSELHPADASERGLVALPLKFRKRADLPFEAPHLVDSLLSQDPAKRQLRTTLNLKLQHRLERQMEKYLASSHRLGIRNASAMLIDWRSMEVKAMLGSADFGNADLHGQVNGTLAKRSPGSLLKPFIYGLAMDQGLIHPRSVLKDAPTAFGPFSPDNFDGAFVGPIDATQALIRSRNVPAVALAARLKDDGLYGFLKRAGISQLATRKHYGLALVLGAGETTMAENLMLYALLPNRGRLRPLHYLQGESSEAGPQLLSEEASYLLIDMLRENPRPDDLIIQGVGGGAPVAWKTGTSWGFRDAWTVGIFGPYVLAVWVGEFDGRSNPAFVGVRAAAPLFFRMRDSLRATRGYIEPARKQPARLARIEVCAASGDLPNAECPVTVTTGFIPGVSPIKLSDVHRRVAVDRLTGRQACPPFADKDLQWELHEFWPSDLMRLFAQAGIPRRPPPAPGECAQASGEGVPPQIVSPLSGVSYSVREARLGEQVLTLKAHAQGDVRHIYWFVDEAFVGRSAPGVALGWVPSQPGQYSIRAVDERGRADERDLRVELVR